MQRGVNIRECRAILGEIDDAPHELRVLLALGGGRHGGQRRLLPRRHWERTGEIVV
jgi:hypothetical protein